MVDPRWRRLRSHLSYHGRNATPLGTPWWLCTMAKRSLLFYLRTFIEQFARRITGTQGKETGDVIMDKYSATSQGTHVAQSLRGAAFRVGCLRRWVHRTP